MESRRAELFNERYQKVDPQNGSWYPPDFQKEVGDALIERTLKTDLTSGSIIEFGCGTGENVRRFLDMGWDAFGVDISASAIERAKARTSFLNRFWCHDLSQPLDLHLPPVDVVLDGHAYHFQVGNDRRVYLLNAARHLKPGGWLIINTNVGDPLQPDVDFDPETRTSKMGGFTMNYWATLDEVRGEMEATGFEVVDSEVVEYQARIAVIWAKKLAESVSGQN
jgi:SAM-dependent methyltransferase